MFTDDFQRPQLDISAPLIRLGAGQQQGLSEGSWNIVLPAAWSVSRRGLRVRVPTAVEDSTCSSWQNECRAKSAGLCGPVGACTGMVGLRRTIGSVQHPAATFPLGATFPESQEVPPKLRFADLNPPPRHRPTGVPPHAAVHF